MTDIKKILQLALPAMVENILQILMGIIDSYLVAVLGLASISGVSVANNIISIYQAIFIALGVAVSSLIAKNLGQRKIKELSYHATEALKLTLIIGLVLGLFSLFFGKHLLALLGTEKVVTELGAQYLAFVGGGIVLLGLMTTLGSILRASGKSSLPMYISFLANILNAILSALLVFVFQFGIAGVALGTLLSRVVGVFFLWKSLPISLCKWTWKVDKELLALALPATSERLMMRAGDVVIIALIVSFGTAVVAGNAIGETLTQFNYMSGLSFATATIILVAQAQGQKDVRRVQAIQKTSFLLSSLTMLAISVLVFLFGQPLTNLFTTDNGAVEASLVVMFYSLLGAPVTAGVLTYTALWQGLGNAKLPFYATTIGMWVIRIGVGYLLVHVFRVGFAGVWIATILDNLFRWLFLYVRFRKERLRLV